MPRRTIHEVSVEGAQRRKPSNRIVYSIKVAWSDGTINIIYRRHSEVLQLELNLLETFPSNKRHRLIPSLQGRIKLVPTSVHTKVDRIRDFLLNLISLPDHISKCQLVISFFTPRPEDLESVEPKTPGSRKKSKGKSTGSILRKISLGHSKTASCIGEPVLLEQYVVLKNYQKQYHNDISLTEGYTVDVIEKHESGWWHVDCEGDIGWVPASFIKPLYGGDNNNEDGDSIVTESFPAGREEIYMTTNSYRAKKEDEISFDIGVNLQVIEKTLDGWWRVIYMNEEGWAPAVYLKRVGVVTGNSPTSLKRLPVMGMQLRDKASDIEEILNTTIQDEGCSLLTPSDRSSWSSQSMRDLRDALPNRGLSISELDLRIANRKEEERMAGKTLKQNRSFSVSHNIKGFFGKTNAAESVSSKNIHASRKVSSSPLLRLKAFSKNLDSSRSIASKLKHSGSENSINQRESRASLPSICITPSASDTEHSPRLSRKLGSIPANVQALGGNEYLTMKVYQLGRTIETKEEKREQENNQFRKEEEKPNALDEKKYVNKHQKRDENKQQKQQVGSNGKGDNVHEGQAERERDGKTEKHGIDKVETEKEGPDDKVFAEEEQENSHSITCRGTDADIYFAVSTYVASGDGEMTVYEGDEVEVLTKAPNGWWMVCIDDDVGWVPSNFLVAEWGQEDDDNQESLESEDDQENAGLSSDDYDGDDDEYEHEDADEHGDDHEEEEEEEEEEQEYFDIVSGVPNPKDEGQSVVWTQPDLRPRQHPDRGHKKRYHYNGPPGLSNHRWFDPVVKAGDVTRRSSGTWSKSSTETNSSNSDKPPRYNISRRKDSKNKASINDKQAYDTETGHNMVHRKKAPSNSKEAVCRQQKWYKRFEAMNGVHHLSKEHYSLSTESRRMPLVKQKNAMSYDSGFPEDERTNAIQRLRNPLLLPDTRANHHKRLSHPTSYKRYKSQFDNGYLVRNLPKYRPDRTPLNVFHVDDSSDGEVFLKTKNRIVYEDSSCDDSAVHSYTRRPRQKRNRTKLPQNASPYGLYHSGGHSSKSSYQAIASYRASTDDTIDLYEGDKVQVIRRSRGGWWFVKIDDEEGWAPSNFLEPITC